MRLEVLFEFPFVYGFFDLDEEFFVDEFGDVGPAVEELDAVFDLELDEVVLFVVVELFAMQLVVYHRDHLQPTGLVMLRYELLSVVF